MKELIQRLIDLAKDWRDFSQTRHGWDCKTYCNERISCYFADNRDHSSVTFKIKHFSFYWDTIDVAFHSPPIISGFTIRSVGAINACISECSKLLEQEKSDFDKLTQEQVKAEKQVKIDILEKRLAGIKDTL